MGHPLRGRSARAHDPDRHPSKGVARRLRPAPRSCPRAPGSRVSGARAPPRALAKTLGTHRPGGDAGDESREVPGRWGGGRGGAGGCGAWHGQASAGPSCLVGRDGVPNLLGHLRGCVGLNGIETLPLRLGLARQGLAVLNPHPGLHTARPRLLEALTCGRRGQSSKHEADCQAPAIAVRPGGRVAGAVCRGGPRFPAFVDRDSNIAIVTIPFAELVARKVSLRTLRNGRHPSSPLSSSSSGLGFSAHYSVE